MPTTLAQPLPRATPDKATWQDVTASYWGGIGKGRREAHEFRVWSCDLRLVVIRDGVGWACKCYGVMNEVRLASTNAHDAKANALTSLAAEIESARNTIARARAS